MAQLPGIYTIQASDAPQHTGKLQEILQNLKKENRIDGFTMLGVEDDLSSLTDKVGEDDLILIVLTNELESQKEQIEDRFRTFKAEQPGARVAEIIVDNVVYDNEFITFPSDLRPVRNREDMDAVWSGIEKSLKDMFPAKKTEEPVPPIDWPKYLKIAGIVVGVILIFFIFRGIFNGGNGSIDDRPIDVQPPVAEEEETQPPEEEPADPVIPATLSGEDCLSFNSQNLRVQDDGNRFLVTDGRSRMMLFRTREKAVEAVRIIRHYQFDTRCFAIRPNPGLSYFKVQRNIPSGSFAGEDCIRINNPQNLTIRASSRTLFQILDGNSIPYAAKSRDEAERIVEIVQHYNAGFTCYVERPDPGMVYLRR